MRQLNQFAMVMIAAIALGGVMVASASAATVVEDFSYASGTLSGKTGGSGWGLAWGSGTTGGTTSRILTDDSANLSYTGGGYNITQTGTGFGYGNFDAFRGINRQIATPMTGTVWFSILMLNGQADDRTGIQFNARGPATYSGVDYARGSFDVSLTGTDLNVRYGGVDSATLATLALGSTHLILGQITIGAGNDTLKVWADPANLALPGAPLFSASSADMGANLYLAGVFSWGTTPINVSQGKFDALRLADGGSAGYLAVTGVVLTPEPGTFALWALGAAACMRRRKS